MKKTLIETDNFAMDAYEKQCQRQSASCGVPICPLSLLISPLYAFGEMTFEHQHYYIPNRRAEGLTHSDKLSKWVLPLNGVQ